MSKRFGYRLRDARSRRGWTQFKLASEMELAGTAPVVEWEKGRRRPRIHTLERLAQILNLSYEEAIMWRGLLGYLPPMSLPSPQQIIGVLEAYAQYLTRLPYPAYISDIRYTLWVVNPPSALLLDSVSEFQSVQQEQVNILRLMFDTRLSFLRRIKAQIAMQFDQVQRYKSFNFLYRHEPYYCNTPDAMRQHLSEADHQHFLKMWRMVHIHREEPVSFRELAPVRLGIIEAHSTDEATSPTIRYQVATRMVPEFGNFFILSQLIPQNQAIFAEHQERYALLPEHSYRLWDHHDAYELMAGY